LPCFHSIERTDALQRHQELVPVFVHSSGANKKTAQGQLARAVWIPASCALAGSSQPMITFDHYLYIWLQAAWMLGHQLSYMLAWLNPWLNPNFHADV
jgi:hypothetical protein